MNNKQILKQNLHKPAPKVSKKDLADYVYSTLSEAIEEIKKRKSNKQLNGRIKRFLGSSEIPDVLKKSEKVPSVLFRQLASPNYEMRRFIALAELGNFKPVVWEYLDDKYVTSNPEKYSLGKMSFYHGTGKKGGTKITRTKVVDLQHYNGKKISEVKTLWGEPLSEFHHELVSNALGNKIDLALFDASKWFKSNGKSANNYYDFFLSLFIQDAILFENFLTEGPEHEFTEQVFLPSFQRVKKALDVKPLIISLDPTEVEGNEFWRCYPPETEGLIRQKLVQS